MENVDISLLKPSGSFYCGYDRLFVVDVLNIETRKVLMSLTVEGSRIYDLVLSVCSNGYMVSVRCYVEKK